MKIAAKKNQTDVFVFFGAIFVNHRGSCDDCNGEVRWGGGSMCVVGWQKSRTKKLNRFRFFRPWFLSLNFPHQQFWEFKILKLFDEDAISQIRGSCNCDGKGGVDDKNCGQKNQRIRSRPAFLWRLQTFSRTGWWSRSASFDTIKPFGLLSTPGFLSCSTRPLSRATPLIWPDYLQCGRALICRRVSGCLREQGGHFEHMI